MLDRRNNLDLFALLIICYLYCRPEEWRGGGAAYKMKQPPLPHLKFENFEIIKKSGRKKKVNKYLSS